MNCAIIGILILILICLFLLHNQKATEHFSSDEAVQNIASLYNQAKLTVTDFVSTGTGTLNNINISGKASLPTITSNNITASAAIKGDSLTAATGAITGDLKAGSLTAGASSLGATNMAGNSKITGNLTVTGQMTPFSEQINVIYPIQWDQATWIKYITDKNFFNKSMPDGTLLKFLFVHPGNMNLNDPYRWARYGHAVKLGNQFLYGDIQSHENFPNPAKNLSNDSSWRGNIN